MILRLGRLEIVELRQAWPDEALSFTPWLAEPENIASLGELIGRELEVEGQEISVGAFAADILARDRAGDRVLIENQLEQTDHRHLGQCLTYVAGLKAKTVIWISQKVREEHRAAIEWLNANTNDDIAFFAIEIELYRIGESDLAPRFNLVAQPNEWARQVERRARVAESELTEAHRDHIEYWTKVIEAASGHYEALSSRTPFRTNWQTAESRRVGPDLGLSVSATRSRNGLRAELYLDGDHAKAAFDLIRQNAQSESIFNGLVIDWERLDGSKASRIAVYEHKQPEASAHTEDQTRTWLVQTMSQLAEALHQVLPKLKGEWSALLSTSADENEEE